MISKEPQRILIFNSHKKLVAVCHSMTETAKSLDTHTQSIYYACTGRCIAVKEHYVRRFSNEHPITVKDIGVLELEKYDNLCGVKYKLYPNSRMERKGMTYKTKKKTA